MSSPTSSTVVSRWKFLAFLAVIGVVWIIIWQLSFYDLRRYAWYRRENVSDVGIAFGMTWYRIKAIPDWDPRDGTHPPLTPKKAIDLATAGLKNIAVCSDKTWELVGVDLDEVDDNKWIYLVAFRQKTPVKNETGRPGFFYYPVPLDGVPIRPLVLWRWLRWLGSGF